MSPTTVSLRADYSAALESYLSNSDEIALLRAYEIGRQALEGGLGILDIVTTHQLAQASLARRARSAEREADMLTRASAFLVESLGPFEMALLGFRDALSALKALNEDLERQVEGRTHELNKSLEELKKVDAERRNLMARLVAAQEEERQRIAADIHDDSVQVMTAVGIRLQILGQRLGAVEDLEALGELEDAVNLSIARLRHLLFELRPPALDREGLAAALRLHLEQIKEDAAFDYALKDRLSAEPPVEVRVILYRIAQEAMANVRKHARASNVDLVLEESDQGVLVRIRDDGVGFSPEGIAEPRPGHLGLTAMRERAQMAGGWCKVESAPGAGALVEFWVPTGGRL